MFEIGKNRFGAFVAERRKQKNLTQKELAEKLYVSDKAVSKWERGLSMPDISLLTPLAESLGVSVAELLACEAMESETISTAQVDDLVKKALTFSEKSPEQQRADHRKNALIYGTCFLVLTLELLALYLLGYRFDQLGNNVFLICAFGVIFGSYAWFFAKERLPAYYDENKISVYSDGAFRMNMPGVRFTNRNWPHIIRVMRIWTICAMTLYLPLFLAADFLLPQTFMTYWPFVQLVLALGGIFFPVYWAAIKYQK